MRPSPILANHVHDLLNWGVIEETKHPGMLGTLFLLPKSDGEHSRALFDARPHNAKVDHCSLSQHGKFMILRPYHQIIIGLALGTRTTNPRIAEMDFRSYFFQFRWSAQLADAHCLRVRKKFYRCSVPVQGSTLMPLVAQTTTAAIAEAPSVRAPPWQWVLSGINVVYDNILISGELQDVERRWHRLLTRCAEVGIVIGDTQPPGQQLIHCGIQYDISAVDDRRWRLAPSWCRRASDWLRSDYRGNLLDRQVLAGIATWALTASLLPLAFIRHTLEGTADDGEKAYVIALLNSGQWRRLRGIPTPTVPDDAEVVITDGSVHGAGIVRQGAEFAVPWPTRRPMEQQQDSEWDAADLALGHVARDSVRGRATLLVTDNVGLLFGLLSGNPSTSHAVGIVRRLHRTLKGPLWLARVPSADNPADRPSRAPKGRVATPWPHPLESRWRSAAVLATWSMADPMPSGPKTALDENPGERKPRGAVCVV